MKFIAALVIFLAVSVPASADVSIEEVLVRRRGQDLNVRVNLLNPGSKPQQGIRLVLYVRPHDQAIWEVAKSWSNIGTLRPGNRSSRDFFEAGNWHLRQIASNPAFEARVTVDYPGGQHQEKIVVYRGDNH